MNHRAVMGLFVLFCGVLLFGYYIGPAAAEPLYLQYNVHAQQHAHDAKASYANWTDPGKGHFIVPAGTAIEIGGSRGGFSIITLSDKKEVYFDYDRGRMGMSVDDYIKLITSPKPISIDAFSQIDRKGISEGKVYEGMTKKGVMTALGYPAAHRTPSPESNSWVYWKDRFRNFTVEFNEQGLVKQIGR